MFFILSYVVSYASSFCKKLVKTRIENVQSQKRFRVRVKSYTNTAANTNFGRREFNIKLKNNLLIKQAKHDSTKLPGQLCDMFWNITTLASVINCSCCELKTYKIQTPNNDQLIN